MRNAEESPTVRSGAVLVVGAGALGCPALAVLASSPIRRLTIIDPDRVERSNLPPQRLYDAGDIGRPKALAAAARLAAAGRRIEPIVDRLTEGNATELIRAHDVVLDCCDHPPTKFLINRVAVSTGRPFCYGGLSRTGGLALLVRPGASACLACVFPELALADADDARDVGCQETGIIAPVAGVVGAYQAFLALAVLGSAADRTAGRLAVYQLRGRRWRFIDFERDVGCLTCGHITRTENTRRLDSCHS